MEKSEASPLSKENALHGDREGLGAGRTAWPTPDLPGRRGGGGIQSSFLTGFQEAAWRWLADKPRVASRLSALTVTEPHKLWAQQHL